jgi:hypothetical protein
MTASSRALQPGREARAPDPSAPSSGPTWPLTGDDRYPPDSPLGHCRNALFVLRSTQQVGEVPPALADLWDDVARRLSLAIAGLERMPVQEPDHPARPR